MHRLLLDFTAMFFLCTLDKYLKMEQNYICNGPIIISAKEIVFSSVVFLFACLSSRNTTQRVMNGLQCMALYSIPSLRLMCMLLSWVITLVYNLPIYQLVLFVYRIFQYMGESCRTSEALLEHETFSME